MPNILPQIDKVRSLGAAWRTKRGYLTILLAYVALVVGPRRPLDPLLLLVLAAGWLIFTAAWFLASGRLILPSQARRRIALCLRVDPEGSRSYQRILRALRDTIDANGLGGQLRIIEVAPDVVPDLPHAHRFRDGNSLDLLVWGRSDYGQVEGRKTLRFRLNYTSHFDNVSPEVLNHFASDMQLFFGGRALSVADANDLLECEVLAGDLFETCLVTLAIFCLIKNETIFAARLLEQVYARIQQENETASLSTAQRARIEQLLLSAYHAMAIEAHGRGDDGSAKLIVERLQQLAPRNAAVLMMAARISYRLGNVGEAKRLTDMIRRIDKRHPALAVSTAFFGILEKNYDRARVWYDRVRRTGVRSEVDLLEVVAFLDEEYERRPDEHALLYGIGVVHGVVDKPAGAKALRRFIKKTGGRHEYADLVRSAREILGTR